MRLKDRTAVVTGGAGEIGRAIAKGYAREGAKVVVADIDLAGAEDTVRQIRDAGGDGLALRVDVTDPEETAEMVRKTVDAYGSLDILVTATNDNKEIDMLKITHAEWDGIMDAALNGVLYSAQACAEQMKKQKRGAMVFVSSIAAVRGRTGQVAYCAAESALYGLTANTAVQLGPHGIRVNGLALGIIDAGGPESLKDQPEYREFRREHTPLMRIGTPEDVAGPAVFLASDEAGFVTGEILTVDGGISIYTNGFGL